MFAQITTRALAFALAFVVCAHPARAELQSIHETATYTRQGALAEVVNAVRAGETLTLDLRFTTDDPAYPGEMIYQNLTRTEIIRSISLKIGERDFGAWLEDGRHLVPDRLVLRPHSGADDRVEIVGEWTATFIAPTMDLQRVHLLLPQLPLIGRFEIVDQ